ncbi:MAG: ribulokinase [Anaerolineae bacterium]|nr:ribulokinase [Anaerolineae bacterium]
MYTIGLDFGTLSARAVLVDVRDGREIATAVFEYPHGVMDTALPSGKPLPHDWALQHPQDYLDALYHCVPAVLRESGVAAQDVVGIGIDFTASSPLPAKADGTPLCFLPEYADHPHAYVKLWKHHASQPQADQINDLARQRGEPWLARYGGKYSAEWFFSKLLQILQEAPEIYRAMDTFVEAADWIVWQLTGVMARNTCTAGYKMLVQDGQYPSREFFAALHPELADVIATKVQGDFVSLGKTVGRLTAPMAARLGLAEGTPVAAPIIDAHVTAAAVRATQAGVMTMIMGTSTCHIISSDKLLEIEGVAGVVYGGVVDGLYGYEAGQAGVGDLFAWFVDHAVPPEYHEAAAQRGVSLHAYLEAEAARQKVGEHGLLALDWWNGNRSTLMDAELSGLLIGMTLATRAPDIYRALIEATAYGTRMIIEAFEAGGIHVQTLVAAGGLPERNALLRQIYADVTGRTLELGGSAHASALGSAIYAAVAAGVYPDLDTAAAHMGKRKAEIVYPIAENQRVYNQLYQEYKTLYDTFGRGANDVMKRLRKLRNQVRSEA